ncbi:40S ribosomal protein S18 [Tubulinosema ratisbonensis]|uniref:40S ribosomal protein S18 n=1 Tax=Tubulinosema ratisbonensis TaxID=291195 RepID=A0A437AI34_9MICR|nr:40S ribosomal protein S18 [Tubulinosema ratisbonensis]
MAQPKNVPTSIQHIIRMFNTNVDGNRRVAAALTQIRGMGKRISDAIVKRSGIDPSKRAGELSQEELDLLTECIANPKKLNLPDWMFNRRNDPVDGTTSHLVGTQIDAVFRLQLEKGKKIGLVRAYRLMNGLKVRGQKTKSNGRGGKTVGVSRKK